MVEQGAMTEAPGWLQRVLIGRKPARTLVRIGVLIMLAYLMVKFVAIPIRIEGISMLPTYQNHQIHVLNRLAYLSHGPQRGDVVGIRLAGEHVMFLKRIIALPGETIAFHHGHTVINGETLAEPYLKGHCDWERPPETLGPDEYYVVGDNRTMEWEDHKQGRAQRKRIVGKIL
jgi:signal peptidase I